MSAGGVNQCAAFDALEVKTVENVRQFIHSFSSYHIHINNLTLESFHYIYENLSSSLRDSCELMTSFVYSSSLVRSDRLLFNRIVDNLSDEADRLWICGCAISLSDRYAIYIPPIVRNNIELAILAINVEVEYFIQYDNLRNNIDVFDKLIHPTMTKYLLNWAGSNIKSNKMLMLKAICIDSYNFSYVGENLKCDIDIINMTIDHGGFDTLHRIGTSNQTFETVMRSVKRDGRSIKYCKVSNLINNYSICRAAVLSCGEALKWINPKLNFYRDLYAEAVSLNSNIARYLDVRHHANRLLIVLYLSSALVPRSRGVGQYRPQFIINVIAKFARYLVKDVLVCLRLVGW